MKKNLTIFCVLLMVAIFFVFNSHALEIKDSRFSDVNESFQRAEYWENKAKKSFRSRPGLAQKQYEHAEDYYLNAEYLLKELSIKYGVNMDKEIAECNQNYRRVHVLVNKARRKARNR